MVKIDVKPEVLFPVRCAWCGVKTSYSTIEHSHSICLQCKAKLELVNQLTPTKQE